MWSPYLFGNTDDCLCSQQLFSDTNECQWILNTVNTDKCLLHVLHCILRRKSFIVFYIPILSSIFTALLHIWIFLLWGVYANTDRRCGIIEMDGGRFVCSVLLSTVHYVPFLGCNALSALWPSVLWCFGRQEGHPACKNLVVGCWRGYLSGARYRLAYGPADASATHCLLLQKNPDGFYLSGNGSPR